MTDDPTDSNFNGLLRGLARAPAAELPPTMIGRFKVTRTLGSGGMGVVYEAEDPTLHRKVAIKLLRAERDGEAADAAAGRLLREAQALAKLSHPNVVTIYEAGRDGHRVYLAMELVVGATARAWREAAARTTDEILAVYRQAAIGLAAAHRAGLVHRDVKPENLLVGDDGRVRVTDFGLVAALEHRPVAGQDPPRVDPMGLTLTNTGAVMGTPPYMPPEAHQALAVDARGDQWSLCVAIWEALGGARPYAGATYPELVDAICAGRRVDPPRPLPDRIRAALERGLAVDPAARWPSVTALLDALAHRSRRGLAVGAGALALAGLGAGAWWMTRAPAAVPRAPDAAVIAAIAPALDAPPVPPDAAPIPVKLHATTGTTPVPCAGDVCGEATLTVDTIVLDLRVEAPPGVVVRVPGGEGGDGATLRLDLETLALPVVLPRAAGEPMSLQLSAEVAAAAGAVGVSRAFTLQVDRVVDDLLVAVRAGEVPWPGEAQPRLRRDVLARVSQDADGELTYLGTIGPPGATLWELDLVAFEEETVNPAPCKTGGQSTDLTVAIFDRRTGRYERMKGFAARTPRCDDWVDVTYDRAEVDAWLASLLEPRPAGVEETPPPTIALGNPVVAQVAAQARDDAATEAAQDVVSEALRNEDRWPVFSKAKSQLARRMKKLKMTDEWGAYVPYGLEVARASRGGVIVQALEVTIPRPGKHDTVVGLITPTWAAIVVGHRLFDPAAAQALFDAITPKLPDAASMDDAASALGWQAVASDPVRAVVPVYLSQPWLSSARSRPLGLAAVLALDYADIVAGYDEYAACDVTTTRVLCTRSDDRVLAHDVLDGLK